MRLTLPPHQLGATTQLLQYVFGSYECASTHPDGHSMSAEVLGLEHTRLLLSGGTKLPVLTLVGAMPLPYLWWLEEVARVPVHLVDATDLTALLNSCSFNGLVVVHGTLSTEGLRLLDVLNCNKHISLSPPVTADTTVLDVKASFAYCTDAKPEGLAELASSYWVRELGAVPALTLNELRQEEMPLFKLITKKPFLTTCSDHFWFKPELLVETMPEPCASESK